MFVLEIECQKNRQPTAEQRKTDQVGQRNCLCSHAGRHICQKVWIEERNRDEVVDRVNNPSANTDHNPDYERLAIAKMTVKRRVSVARCEVHDAQHEHGETDEHAPGHKVDANHIHNDAGYYLDPSSQ